MPATQRLPDTSVVARLREAPQRFEFFQAVRILRRYFRRDASSEHEPLGDQIRFGNSLNMGFAPSEIEALRLEAHEPEATPAWPAVPSPIDANASFMRAHLTPSFIGLTGTSGTLPNAYTEQLIDREITHRDRGARAFLDLFTNRAVSLFYLAWEKHRLPLRYEHDRQERFLPMTLSLLGLGADAQIDEACGPDRPVLAETLAYYGGALRQSARSAGLIERVLSDYFDVPVKVIEFAGRWHTLGAEDCTSLGGAHALLGEDALCGERIWQCEDGIELEIGPLRRARFASFLPGGDAARALQALVQSLAGLSLRCTVRPVLAREDISGPRLDPHAGPRLGNDMWLHDAPPSEDGRDAAFDLDLLAQDSFAHASAPALAPTSAPAFVL
ncbi:type VI secretion system baseplate subunit TssG [Niveibacterium sp. SC-1]|uniref:type VI secretion system baseplate subunit TssG n=1 Tax=Niveibacterium sp. SC-1 TaxID=3135646 RepID=UPI00311F8B8F